MEARAKLLGHPVHQMLIVLPLGLLSGAVSSLSGPATVPRVSPGRP